MINIEKKKLIIDTDVGLDDAECMTFLTATQKFDILAITLVAGNASIPVISDNCCRMMSFLGTDNIPIYAGTSYNLKGDYIESDGYFGKNAFCDIILPCTDKKINKDMRSAVALVHYARKYPHQVNILCIGPLTNLAMAFLIDEEFPSLVESINIVGTDDNEITIKHNTTFSEFNANCDPLSYKIVNECFKNRIKVPFQIVDWGVCYRNLLSFSIFDRLNQISRSNPFLNLFKIITDKENPLVRRNYWEEGFLTGDLVMGVGLYDPDIFIEKRRVSMKMDHFGDTPGHVIYTDDPQGNFVIVSKIDTKRMEDDIIDVLSNAPVGSHTS